MFNNEIREHPCSNEVEEICICKSSGVCRRIKNNNK